MHVPSRSKAVTLSSRYVSESIRYPVRKSILGEIFPNTNAFIGRSLRSEVALRKKRVNLRARDCACVYIKVVKYQNAAAR